MDTLVQQPYNLFAPRKQQAQDWADQTMQRMGIGQQKPQPITPPYEVGQRPAPKVNPADMTYVDDGKGNIIPSWEQKPATTIPAQVASQMESLDPGTFGGGIAGTGKRASIGRPITNMDELAQAMNYTSPQEEERLRKASVANQRIMAVADAIRHIGNIANTVNYAPSQQFNNPVQEEYARYQQGKALRDRANQAYLSYQQQKAAQDEKARQWAAQQAAAERDYQFKVEKDRRDAAETKRRNDAIIANYANIMANRDNTFQHKVETDNRRLDISQQNANTSAARVGKIGQGKTGSGYTTVTTRQDTYDANGKKNGYKTTSTKTVGGKTTKVEKRKSRTQI